MQMLPHPGAVNERLRKVNCTPKMASCSYFSRAHNVLIYAALTTFVRSIYWVRVHNNLDDVTVAH